MSNYRARQRAIAAERKLDRVRDRLHEQMHDMKEHHRRAERRIYNEAAEEFRLRHLHMEAQMKALTDAIVTARRMDCSIIMLSSGARVT